MKKNDFLLSHLFLVVPAFVEPTLQNFPMLLSADQAQPEFLLRQIESAGPSRRVCSNTSFCESVDSNRK